MKIIVSPAKTMNVDHETMSVKTMPYFMSQANELKNYMRSLSYEELKKLLSCSDKLALINYERYQTMDLTQGLTPALLAYEGIQYQYMAPQVFSTKEWAYIEKHLTILSGFYGVLEPFDGIVPYRLEMKGKVDINQGEYKSLYSYWKDVIYNRLMSDNHTILNLASKEYSIVIEKYLTPERVYVTPIFGMIIDGKVKVRATIAKMARGEMVRFMAENEIKDLEELKGFNRLGFVFNDELSSKRKMVFIKQEEKEVSGRIAEGSIYV